MHRVQHRSNYPKGITHHIIKLISMVNKDIIRLFFKLTFLKVRNYLFYVIIRKYIKHMAYEKANKVR